MKKFILKIKRWWRKQESFFKKDLKFNGILLFIGIIFLIIYGNPGFVIIIIPVIAYILVYSSIFRIVKYGYTKVIKRHKDYIYISKQLNETNDKLIQNLEDRIKTYEGLLNSTYVFVPWPSSQKFTIHKRFDECCIVKNGCMVPYDIYIETITKSKDNNYEISN